MNVTLYDHQMGAVNGLRKGIQLGYNRLLLTMPTGSGKTYVYAYIAYMLNLNNKRTGIITHRDYLRSQGSKAMDIMGVPHGIVAPGYTKTQYNIQLASVDTLIRRLDQYNFDYLIFDEGHHVYGNNKWAKLINYYDCKCIGVTATGLRGNGAGLGVKSGGHYNYLVQGPQILDLTPEYLCPVECYVPQVLDTSGVSRVAGDFNLKELEKISNKKKIYGNVPYYYRKICDDVPAIAFCVTIDHAKNVADHFKSFGIPATYISGKCSDGRRESVLTGFDNGIYKVLCSCDLIDEGFDVPSCGAVIQLRKTESIVKFMQQNGRCMRIEEGKKNAFIIDHVGNLLNPKLGAPDQDRAWSLDGYKKESEKSTRALIVCPKCCRAQYSAKVCIHCGFELVARKKNGSNILVDENAELIKFKSKYESREEKKARLNEMMENAKSLKDFHKIAREFGYKGGWAWHVWNNRQKKGTIEV